jgi:hypothetical protein
MECCRYEKDGTPKKSFAGKNAQHNLRNGSVQHKQNSYVQFSGKITKLEKSNKKLRHVNKKKKHDCYSDTKDSNSMINGSANASANTCIHTRSVSP